MAKLPKSEVEFEHPAKGKDHCGECRHYEARGKRCQIVAGTIEPEDWCDRFEARKIDLRALIVRHGRTVFDDTNPESLKGRIDTPLDKDGLLVAVEAGRFLASLGQKIDEIYSSPLLRAIETAKLISGLIDAKKITQTRELFPWDIGPEFMGKPKNGSGFERFIKNPGETPKFGQSLNDLCQIVGDFFDRQLESGHLCLYVTHNSVIRCLNDLTKGITDRSPKLGSVIEEGGVAGVFANGGDYELVALFRKECDNKYASR